MDKKNSLIGSILSECAPELGLKLMLEPEFGYAGRIETRDGRIFYFHSTFFDINPLGAGEIANDKAYASYFMKQLGYPTPTEGAFYSDEWCTIIHSSQNTEAAVKFAEKIGYPVMVKPNSESQGRGVEKVYTESDLRAALAFVFEETKDRVALVQKVVEGTDYRIVVLDTEVLCCYKRTALSVIGDGTSTIKKLLEQKQQAFFSRDRLTAINLTDLRITRGLKQQQMDLQAVVNSGIQVQILNNANLSSGGEAEDVTTQLHKDYKAMAVKLTHDMGLTFCGIDIMTPYPINQPLQDYTVIEINAAPGLDYYAEGGPAQKHIVKELYRKLLLKMIEKI